MKGILLITASVFFSLLLPAQDKFLEKADAALQRRLVDGQSAGFIILMRDQADISQSDALQLKNEKAHYVFDVPREYAAIRRASFIGMLEGHGTPFQPMFLLQFDILQSDLFQILTHHDFEKISIFPCCYL